MISLGHSLCGTKNSSDSPSVKCSLPVIVMFIFLNLITNKVLVQDFTISLVYSGKFSAFLFSHLVIFFLMFFLSLTPQSVFLVSPKTDHCTLYLFGVLQGFTKIPYYFEIFGRNLALEL